MIHIVIEMVNMLLVYPQITFVGVVSKYIKCDYLSEINVVDLSLKSQCGHVCSSSRFILILHIIVDKDNELLVYPHITLKWRCTKLVKCDYLTQIKLFDLCFKIHSGHRWSRSKFMPSSSHHCRQA